MDKKLRKDPGWCFWSAIDIVPLEVRGTDRVAARSAPPEPAAFAVWLALMNSCGGDQRKVTAVKHQVMPTDVKVVERAAVRSAPAGSAASAAWQALWRRPLSPIQAYRHSTGCAVRREVAPLHFRVNTWQHDRHGRRSKAIVSTTELRGERTAHLRERPQPIKGTVQSAIVCHILYSILPAFVGPFAG